MREHENMRFKGSTIPTVGNVHEFVWAVKLDLVLEQDALDQTGMQLSYSVDLVGHASQQGHSNALRLRLLDQ